MDKTRFLPFTIYRSPFTFEFMSTTATSFIGDERAGEPAAGGAQAKVSVRDLNFFYGATQALFNISLDIAPQRVTAFIGPSGCGKSTFLRTLNRMNDTIPDARAVGQVLIDGEDIYAPGLNV